MEKTLSIGCQLISRLMFQYPKKIFLIIHGHRVDWLIGLLDALKDAMREVVKQWNLRDSNVKVFNEEIALENKIIVAYIPKADLPSVRQENGNADSEKVAQWFYDHNS